MVKAFLHPRPGYVPKVPANVVRSIMLQAFCPPPFQNADQERRNLLCPVRALDAYVHRAALWRKNEQLFVCFGPHNKGSPASKQMMGGRGPLTCLWIGRSTFPYGCLVPLDQEYGGLQGPNIRSCSPRGLWCVRLVLTAHIRQILFFGPGLYPRVPSALILVLLVRFTQDRHSSLCWCYISFPLCLNL